MGIPELKIGFKEVRNKSLEGATVGVALLILKDKTLEGIYEYLEVDDIKEKFEEKNRKYIEDTFIGNVQDVRVGNVLEERSYRPSKVIVYALSSKKKLDEVLDELESVEFNYMCMPDATDAEDYPKLIDFIKRLPEIGYDATLVASTSKAPNNSNIVNFKSEEMELKNGEKYTAAQLLPFITGACAGTPLSQSTTYCVVPFVSDIKKRKEEDISKDIEDGKLVLLKKGGIVRIARGVTSMTEPAENEGESFKKIKITRTYKYIHNSLKKVISNYYVGKVANTYDNKCLLLSEVDNYMHDLARDGIIESDYTVKIDVEANKKYLKEHGIDYSKFTSQELKEANTGSKVFLAIKLRGIDAMEDFYINITV